MSATITAAPPLPPREESRPPPEYIQPRTTGQTQQSLPAYIQPTTHHSQRQQNYQSRESIV